MFMLNRFSERYDVVVKNITQANQYNIEFKEDLDYAMYIIVVNSERADQLVDVAEPYELIDETRQVFNSLYDIADTREAQNKLTRILKSLDTLEKSVDEIVNDAKVSGNYDLNLERLDLNIRILTELIQEQIQEYIYYEATNLETIREDIRADVTKAILMAVLMFAVVFVGASYLVRRIKKSITEPVQATELKLLQAQINPHFLYNTLDTIVWLAETKQNEQVSKMVTSLSDFFRTTLSKGMDYITVREEESHIRSYLEIQQFRYRDILEYNISIDDGIYEYEILKMTLQPLVENALYHGIKNKRGMGHITVTGVKQDENMVFTVADDGLGMKEDRLEFMRRVVKGEEKDAKSASSGFGLYNVAKRLQLNYGSKCSIDLQSTYGEGTTITITIPVLCTP
jgi:two-component system sensor histidine kinase YesM